MQPVIVLREGNMVYIAIGTFGFVLINLFDFTSLKRIYGMKPVTWFLGCGLLTYALIMTCLQPGRLSLPVWSTWLGWALLSISILMLIYSLFINLPFRKTYVTTANSKLITTGMYALVRHPGVHWFILFLFSLILISRSSLLLIAAPVFILLDIVLVVVQEKLILSRMFTGYRSYRRRTPMLVPNRRSIRTFFNSLKQFEPKSQLKEEKMTVMGELLKQGKTDEVWQRCCGFIDLSLEDFMKIQKRLLLEQMELLKKCELGRYILNGASPRTVEQFREQVPLTSYADYEPYLLKRKSKGLPEKPILWQHTSGRSGEYPFKWVPLTNRQYHEIGPALFSAIIFSSCQERGDVALEEHDKYLYALAPAPYLSGVGGRRVDEENILDFMPPLDEAERMEFSERVQKGFKMALLEGMDIFGGLSSVLVAIGDRFAEGNGATDIRPFLRRPKALLRLAKGYARSKLARRPLLPRDIWSLKGVVAGGTDTTVFRDKIQKMWGRYPLNIYACTEALVVAVQTWDYQGMTFIPNLNFLEFIPEKETIKSREDPAYQPKTLLLDELAADENYELVITNFLGGALVRYRNGDMIRITSLRNEQLGIDIPQMEFHSRVDDLIDIAGFTRLTEGIIWQAIERSGVACKEWTARKEVKEQQMLHLYLELKDNGHNQEAEIALDIHRHLKALDSDYANIESFLGQKSLEVTLLPENAFEAYRLKQKEAGADMVHLRVPHINPSDSTIDFLVRGCREVAVADQQEQRPVTTRSR